MSNMDELVARIDGLVAHIQANGFAARVRRDEVLHLIIIYIHKDVPILPNENGRPARINAQVAFVENEITSFVNPDCLYIDVDRYMQWMNEQIAVRLFLTRICTE